jgi:hypothetical protein
MADKEIDYGELFFGIKAGEGMIAEHRGEQGMLFNPGLNGTAEMMVWGRVFEILDSLDHDPSVEELTEYVEASVVATAADKRVRRYIEPGTDWHVAQRNVLRAILAYRDECLRLTPPGGEA